MPIFLQAPSARACRRLISSPTNDLIFCSLQVCLVVDVDVVVVIVDVVIVDVVGIVFVVSDAVLWNSNKFESA